MTNFIDTRSNLELPMASRLSVVRKLVGCWTQGGNLEALYHY